MAIVPKLQSIINKANQTTGKQDKDLTAAVTSLVAGYGSGSGGLDTSDATAVAEEVPEGKTFYAKGKKVIGSCAFWQNNSYKPSDEMKILNFSSGRKLCLRATTTFNQFVPGQTLLGMSYPIENFGDATAADVAAGKTFTSAAGLRMTGTATAGGGSSSKNCEAYTITVTNPTVHFKGTGTIKAWGYAEGQKVSYSTPKYAFHGDKYTDLSSFQATEKALTLSVDSSGKVTGLPAMTKGSVILTIGV